MSKKKKPKSYYFIRRLFADYYVYPATRTDVTARFLFDMLYDYLPKNWQVENEDNKYINFVYALTLWMDYMDIGFGRDARGIYYKIGLKKKQSEVTHGGF